MPKEKSPHSKNSKIAALKVGETVTFDGANQSSIRVVCSQIKVAPENKDKKFKVKSVGSVISVERVL